MHLQPLYENSPFFGTKLGESLFIKGLCLPSGSALQNEDIRKIAGLIKECYLQG
jgi:dTDP-4-amino-4,6-dideoxygalactose transaminase